MKKILILILCLSLLTGCVSLPAFATRRSPSPAAVTAVPAAPEITPLPLPEATQAPADTLAPDPDAPAAPMSTPAPTTPPDQTYEGTYFRFDAPGDWLRADISSGVCFYPEPGDTRHTYLLYKEMANDMKLTESSVDIALMFSSQDTITAMVAGALSNSGLTDFSLSPVTVTKTKINGATCYQGTSDITMDGRTSDCVGNIFLRKEKMILLIWVGDRTRYADGLATVYGSFRTIP